MSACAGDERHDEHHHERDDQGFLRALALGGLRALVIERARVHQRW